MKRWLSAIFITTYLATLTLGICSHTLKWGTNSHPVMYFVLWDMFCGWSAYEQRFHIIAEGESGAYYDVANAPWRRFTPFGDVARHHYDGFGHTFQRTVINTLKQTEHEPIHRVFVVEENWHKKYNLPDSLWRLRFDEPKEPHSYYWLRMTFNSDGEALYLAPDFITYVNGLTIADNPRLMADARRGRPFYAVSPGVRNLGGDGGDPTAWAGPNLSASLSP